MVSIKRRPFDNSHEVIPNIHPVLQRIYCGRGIYCHTELERSLQHLIPYHQLKNIEQAVSHLTTALTKQQHIMIIGDFDADGATSTALAVSALQSLGAKHVSYLVPNRFIYGYGLTPEIVQEAAKQQPDLIITVDNGIASHAGVAMAKSLNIPVLITDHHLPGSSLPEAIAIVNPNQPGDSFPSKNLAGVGVIFYLMLALRAHLRNIAWFKEKPIPEPNLAELLDLVALGTVADVVPLDKNNRILVHQGLLRIKAGQCRPGILALLEISKRIPARLTATDLGFALGPRLNAAGRLDDMSLGIACLLATDITKARTIAQTLDELNNERKAIETEMQQQAFTELNKLKLQTHQLPYGLCLYEESWHQGVIGILASRIKDQLHRPIIAFAQTQEGELKGSARSVNGLHIRDALDAIATRHPGLISKFGGHAMAAGLSLSQHNFSAFSKAFDEEVRRHLSENDLRGELHTDGELAETELSLELAKLIRDAGPWGQAFPEPLFDGHFNIIEQRIVGGKHLKMVLTTANMQLLDAIAFNVNLEAWPNHRVQSILAAYRLDINEYNGRQRLQLIIEHLIPVTNSY